MDQVNPPSPIVSAADRAARLHFEALCELAQSTVYASSAQGCLNSGGHILRVKQLLVKGFRDICDVAVSTVAEIEGDRASAQSDQLRKLLLSYQLEVDAAFVRYGSPGHSPVRQHLDKQVPAFRAELETVLDGVLDDLGLGLVGGAKIKSSAPTNGGVHIDVAGEVTNLMINSPGAIQKASERTGLEPQLLKELIEALEGLQREAHASTEAPEVVVELQDAIVSAQREIGASEPDGSRLRRYLEAVRRAAQQIGISAAGSFLGQVIAAATRLG